MCCSYRQIGTFLVVIFVSSSDIASFRLVDGKPVLDQPHTSASDRNKLNSSRKEKLKMPTRQLLARRQDLDHPNYSHNTFLGGVLNRQRRACGSGYSTCCNSKCVKTSYIRDGDNDCGDNSDETSPAFQCDQISSSGKYLYSRTGNCGNNEYIKTLSECNTAARDLGLDDQSAEEITEGANRPYSCYFKYTSSEGNRLYFNTAGDKSYVSTERRSLCKLVDECPAGTFVYHSGSHCCRVNRDGNGQALKYTGPKCENNNYMDCPGGAVDGRCKPTCDGELNTYKSGIKTCNSDGCSIAYTFAALPAPATVVSAHLSVRQAGDLDSSSEYAVLKAGGSTMADCKQSTTNWQSPAACQRVDVKSKISSQVATALSGGNDDSATNLQRCTGECDADSQCAAGLRCFQRDNGESIPGCTGSGGGNDWDYCYNGPSSNGYTYRSKGAYYCSGSRSEFSGTFSTLASCQAACSAKLECHTLNFYPNSDACYWCPSSGWSSEVTGSANGQMWEKGDAVTTSTAATTTVAGADTPTYSLAVELDSTSSVDADDDDSNGPTNTMLGADFTLVVCEDPGCAKGTKKDSGQACVSCAANEYQPLDKYEGLTCTPQPYCGRGQKTSADTKLAKRTCASCTSGQYQDSSSHRDVACKAQPSCARGEKISSASVRTKQTCSQCPDGYYQDTSSHSEVTCKAQPYCGKDQKISTPSSAVLQTCSSCPAGQIQPTTSHREASCISECGANSYLILDGGRASCTPQPFCSAGQKMSPDSAISKRTCSSCGTRTYQDSQRHRETTCKPQPLCDKGMYLPSSKGTTVKKQLCEACPDNTYQQLDSFAGTSCTVQATCNAGFYISAPSEVTKQECTPCPIGEYQVSNNHRNTKCLKQPESKCQKGEYVSGVSATTKGFCKEDIPCGEDRIYVRLLGEEGKCVVCPDGTAQPLTAHFESICSATVRCDLPSRELGSTSTFTDAVTCNGRGTASQSGECACELGTTGCQCQCTIGPNTDGTCFSCASGYAGIRCQFSDKDSCSGRGAVQSDGTCNDCERGSAGTYCEFTDDDYCCGAGSVNDQGVCGQCGPGYSGTHCEHADGITCFGNGEAQGDGSCLCKDGFNAETNCAECNLNIASSGSSGDELCDTCVPEMLGSSFPACDIPTCTKHGVASASGLECVCGVGWRGDRCECFDDNAGEESACLACANGDDGIAYTMKSGACEMNGKRRRGGSSFGSVVGDIPAPRISAGGASASKHRNRRFDWSCATTTTTTTLSKSPTTSPITTTTSTENPLFVRLRAEEAEALKQYEQRRADHEERLASHDLIVEEFEKKCGGVDGGRARRNSSDEGNMACNEFDVRPCLQGECKPCFSGKKQSKSGDACDVACGDCVLYANSCINADDDDDTDDADDDGDDAVQSEADQKATECAFLKKQFEDSERSLAAAKQALDRADTAKTAASTAYTTALDDAASAERECLLLSQEGIDSQTIVLIVAFILLAIAQGGARFTRQYDQHKVSLTVEVIVFFSILDQITDATYVITETFRSGTLKALGTTFCILPVITMMVYFYYKCYRVTTKENLIWRFKQAIRPFTDVPKGLMYTVVYPVFALMLSAILMMVVFLPLPLEAALLPLEMGFRIGFGKGKELAVWANEKAESWSEKTILGLIPSILLYCGVFVYAILTMVYHVLLAVFLPFLWAIMMVVRTFAILPGVWVWIENECDFMLQHMKEPSPTGLFAYQSPRKSAACGEDLGVFRLFHPSSEDSTPKNKVPIIDYEAQYLMLSGTLVFEFVFESLPQIIIQIVNNFENESWAKTECVDILDGDAIKRIGWRTFTVMSVVLSGFVAIDSLYRQLFQTFVKKQPFGSPASFGVKDDEQKHIKKGLEMREDVGKLETLRKQRRTSMKEAQKKAGRVQKKAKSRAARGADSGLVSFAKSNRARGSGRPKNKSNTKLNPMFQSEATFENPMYSFDNTVDGYMDVR